MPAHKSSSVGLRKFALSFSAFALALVLLWYFIAEAELPGLKMRQAKEFRFEAITGIFIQSDPETDPKTFDYTQHNFGLINRSYPSDTNSGDLTQWQRFEDYVQSLNSQSPEEVSYKVLYMGRHGEGFHNVAEDYYGREAWDDHWSKLEGNGTVTWADAHLTDKGEAQAFAARGFLAEHFASARMPFPDKYFVSPLHRCLETARLEFAELELPHDRPFQPLIKELLREALGQHTCDRRSSKTQIMQDFPDWAIEEGFTEEDELWKADHRETHAEHDKRTEKLLNDIFAANGRDVVFLSLTSHSGAIASHLRVLGHREFRLPTGAMIPILVKISRAVGG